VYLNQAQNLESSAQPAGLWNDESHESRATDSSAHAAFVPQRAFEGKVCSDGSRINIYFIDEDKVTPRAQGIGMVGGLGLHLGPHEKKDLTYSGRFGADGRIIQLFGHRHAWTPRFAVWLLDKLVYDSWDWEESVTFNYDSSTTNPPIDTQAKHDGAISGILEFKAGDELKFTCYIENDSDNTLGFSNQVYEGEMCNLWGSAVGAGLSGTYF